MNTAARAALAAGAVAAIIILILLLPYWHAAALILRAGGAGGFIGRAAQRDARRVEQQITRITTSSGEVRARIFKPSNHPNRAILLVSGVHPDGIDEPRLVDLANDLAGTGVNVVTPEVPDLVHYRLTARVTDTIEQTAQWLSRQQDLTGSNRIGMIGVSFSGGLSIVAAGRSGLRDHVSYVLSFGGHGNLPRVLRYYSTGIEPSIEGETSDRRPPHDYALAVFLYQAADLAVPADQTASLRRGIDAFLQASALARIDQKRATALMQLNRDFQRQLPEPAATLLRLVNDRNVSELGSRLLPYVDQLGQDPALSPDRSPAPAAAVYLLHGTDDNVIPPAESDLLAEYLRPHTRVRVLLSSFLTHVDLSNHPGAMDTWRMITFWKGALSE